MNMDIGSQYDLAFVAALGIPIENIVSDLKTVAECFVLQTRLERDNGARLKFQENIKNLFIESVLQAISTTTVLGKRKVINYKTFAFIPQDQLLKEYAPEQLEEGNDEEENRRKRYYAHITEITDHVLGHIGALKIIYYGQKIVGEVNQDIRRKLINVETIALILKEIVMLSSEYDPEFHRIMVEYFKRNNYGSIYGYANFLEMCFDDENVVEKYKDKKSIDNTEWKNFNEIFFFFLRWTYADPEVYEKIKATFNESKPIADLQIILETVFNNLYAAINLYNRTKLLNLSIDKLEKGFSSLMDNLKKIYGKEKVNEILLKFFSIYDKDIEKLNHQIHKYFAGAEAYQYFNYRVSREEGPGIRDIFFEQ